MHCKVFFQILVILRLSGGYRRKRLDGHTRSMAFPLGASVPLPVVVPSSLDGIPTALQMVCYINDQPVYLLNF